MRTAHPNVSGRRPPHPEATHPRLHASAVLTSGYTGAVPAVVNWWDKVPLPMDLNDSLGDCTIADVAHAVAVFTQFGQGSAVVLSDADVLAVYERVGGYRPGDPSTDNGCVIQDVLDDWRKTGISNPAHKIAAFLAVNYKDSAELKACTWLFGGVTLGVNFPKSAMAQFNNGQPWDYDPTADNTIDGGHDVRLLGIAADGTMRVATWGAIQRVTPAWLAHYCEEAWAQADQEWIKANASPEGLSVAALNAAFTQITHGQPGPFTGTTPPGPAPVPSPAITPEQTAANVSLATVAHRFVKGRHWTPENTGMARELGMWLQAWGL